MAQCPFIGFGGGRCQGRSRRNIGCVFNCCALYDGYRAISRIAAVNRCNRHCRCAGFMRTDSITFYRCAISRAAAPHNILLCSIGRIDRHLQQTAQKIGIACHQFEFRPIQGDALHRDAGAHFTINLNLSALHAAVFIGCVSVVDKLGCGKTHRTASHSRVQLNLIWLCAVKWAVGREYLFPSAAL